MADTYSGLDLASRTGQNDIFNAIIAAFAALGGISVNVNHVDVTADRQAAETARDQAVAAKNAITNATTAVATGEPGTDAAVTITTDSVSGNLVFNFTIPRGNAGVSPDIPEKPVEAGTYQLVVDSNGDASWASVS